MLQSDEMPELMQRHCLDEIILRKRVGVVSEPTMVHAIEHHVRLDDGVVVKISRKRDSQRSADFRAFVVDQHSPSGCRFLHTENHILIVFAVDVHARLQQFTLLKFQDGSRHRLPLSSGGADGV